MLNKNSIRKSLLDGRKKMRPEHWQFCSQKISERLGAEANFEAGQTILAYFSTRQEPDLTRLWESFPLLNFGFPRCEKGHQLRWYRWQLGELLMEGKFGILEPSPTALELQAVDVDWILVPTIGIDRRGYRIGYGGGFYDRLFANPIWRDIPTIGITFDFCVVEDFQEEDWDVPLNYICTETEWITCSR